MLRLRIGHGKGIEPCWPHPDTSDGRLPIPERNPAAIGSTIPNRIGIALSSACSGKGVSILGRPKMRGDGAEGVGGGADGVCEVGPYPRRRLPGLPNLRLFLLSTAPAAIVRAVVSFHMGWQGAAPIWCGVHRRRTRHGEGGLDAGSRSGPGESVLGDSRSSAVVALFTAARGVGRHDQGACQMTTINAPDGAPIHDKGRGTGRPAAFIRA